MDADIKSEDKISRTIPLLLCVASVVLCLLYAYLRPNLPPWWKQVGGGVPYVMFWVLLWFVALPNRKHIFPICVGVAFLTTLLEFLPLWNPEPLATFRKTTLGAAWLGSQFSWADIPPYFIGAAVGCCLLHLLFWSRAYLLNK